MKKLAYKNNWEHDRYWINDEEVIDLTLVMINDIYYPVTSRVVTVPYSDMGHNYSSTSKHYFIKSNDLGVDVDLSKVIRIHDVFAIDYEVQ